MGPSVAAWALLFSSGIARAAGASRPTTAKYASTRVAPSCGVCTGETEEGCYGVLKTVVQLMPAKDRMAAMGNLLSGVSCSGLAEDACTAATDAAFESLGWDTVVSSLRKDCESGAVVLTRPAVMTFDFSSLHESTSIKGAPAATRKAISQGTISQWRGGCTACARTSPGDSDGDDLCAEQLLTTFAGLDDEDRLSIYKGVFPTQSCDRMASDEAGCLSIFDSKLARAPGLDRKAFAFKACSQGLVGTAQRPLTSAFPRKTVPNVPVLVAQCAACSEGETGSSCTSRLHQGFATLADTDRLGAYKSGVLKTGTAERLCAGMDESACVTRLDRHLTMLNDPRVRKAVSDAPEDRAIDATLLTACANGQLPEKAHAAVRLQAAKLQGAAAAATKESKQQAGAAAAAGVAAAQQRQKAAVPAAATEAAAGQQRKHTSGVQAAVDDWNAAKKQAEAAATARSAAVPAAKAQKAGGSSSGGGSAHQGAVAAAVKGASGGKSGKTTKTADTTCDLCADATNGGTVSDKLCLSAMDAAVTALADGPMLVLLQSLFPDDSSLCSAADSQCLTALQALYTALTDKTRLHSLETACEAGLLSGASATASALRSHTTTTKYSAAAAVMRAQAAGARSRAAAATSRAQNTRSAHPGVMPKPADAAATAGDQMGAAAASQQMSFAAALPQTGPLSGGASVLAFGVSAAGAMLLGMLVSALIKRRRTHAATAKHSAAASDQYRLGPIHEYAALDG